MDPYIPIAASPKIVKAIVIRNVEMIVLVSRLVSSDHLPGESLSATLSCLDRPRYLRSDRLHSLKWKPKLSAPATISTDVTASNIAEW